MGNNHHLFKKTLPHLKKEFPIAHLCLFLHQTRIEMEISDRLIDWYLKNKREMPWRETTDPYKIWISEIILQQTRVAQGLDYYRRFVEQFPDVRSLAQADEEAVLKCWQGLGYYSRARNLHFAAKTILETHNGEFPKTHKEILSLKGIGDYTAAAISSFAFGLPYAAVDGNFYRVLSRVFEIATPIDSSKGKAEFQALAQELIDRHRPGLFNQAVMDLGATVCTPSSPSCNACPLREVCLAHAHNTTSTLPSKNKKTNSRNRHFFYFLIDDNGATFLHKREGNDIWKGLYELPLIETDEEMEVDKVLSNKNATEFLSAFSVQEITKTHRPATHVLSHQHITATLIEAKAKPSNQDIGFIRIDKRDLDKYPISRLTEILLSKI